MRAKITITNNKCKVEGATPILQQFRNETRVKHPNAYWIRMKGNGFFDGYIYILSEYGMFENGYLPVLVDYLEKHNVEIVYQDNRNKIPKYKIPDKVGDKVLRPYQKGAIKSVVARKVGELPFQISVLKMATNAGKTLISAGIHESFKVSNCKTIMLINDSDLFDQFKTEIPQLLGDDCGFIRGQKDQKWANFTVAMVQTLALNINKYRKQLSEFDICIIDEADLADNKTYKKVIQNLYNTSCRVGLSGSIYVSNLAKDRIKNINLFKFFSSISYEITKRELMDMGISAELIVKICEGNTKPFKELKGVGFLEAYKQIITNNKDRNKKILERVHFNSSRGRLPILVICQFKDHTELLCKLIAKEFPKYRVRYAHSGVPDKVRNSVMADFRSGKIDILVSSYIVKRGKNFPLIKSLINAGASDSNENIIQIMGRAERTHESKKQTYMDDFYDVGPYLERHSKHRINYYRKEKITIINVYKK